MGEPKDVSNEDLADVLDMEADTVGVVYPGTLREAARRLRSLSPQPIEEAILAERERCATIGYAQAVHHCSDRNAWQIAHSVGQGVKAAILAEAPLSALEAPSDKQERDDGRG